MVVAAGNDNKDASDYSPARVEEAITVAASTFADQKADFSNWGAPVNIWAAGLNVTSTWNDGRTKTISGTSMATPHVAGFAAYLLGTDPTLSPGQIAKLISDKAQNGLLGGVREYFYFRLHVWHPDTEVIATRSWRHRQQVAQQPVVNNVLGSPLYGT